MRNKYIGADIAARLHGTVVRYKNKPFYCIVDGNEINLRTLSDDRLYARINPTDPELDVSSLPLGYVNYTHFKTTVHIRRHPLRRYKQGVDPQALTYTTISKNYIVHGEVFKNQGFQENVDNKYPPLASAIKMMTTAGWDSVALSREIALVKDGNIFKVYMSTDEVGFIRAANGTEVNKCSIRKTDVSWVIRSALGKVGIIVEEGLV